MSAAFGWSVEDTEREVVALIQRGEIRGRVDSQNKILRARSTNHRAQLYAHALRAGAEMQGATNKLLLRLQLYAPTHFDVVLILSHIFLLSQPTSQLGRSQGTATDSDDISGSGRGLRVR